MNNQRLLQHICKISDWLPGWASWLKPSHADVLEIPSDLEVEQSGVCFIDGRDELDYLWYQLREAVDAGNMPGIASCGCCNSLSCLWKHVPILDCCRRCAPFCVGCMGRKSAFYILQPASSRTTNFRWGSFNATACPPLHPRWKRLALNPIAAWRRSKGP